MLLFSCTAVWHSGVDCYLTLLLWLALLADDVDLVPLWSLKPASFYVVPLPLMRMAVRCATSRTILARRRRELMNVCKRLRRCGLERLTDVVSAFLFLPRS